MQVFLALTLLAYVAIAVANRTSRISDFYVAGGAVRAVFNGMAIAASFIPLLLLAGAACGVQAGRQEGLALMLGGAGGLVLIGFALAPGLRKFEGMTVPDFLGERFGGTPIRFAAVVVLILCSFPLLALALRILGAIGAGVFTVTLGTGVVMAMVMILLAGLFGGMRSLSWTQSAQYAVLFAATLAASVMLWGQQAGVPQSAGLGGVLDAASAFRFELITVDDRANRYGLIVCLIAGTASLPHLLMRSFAGGSTAEARVGFFWAFLFAACFGLAAPTAPTVFAAASSGTEMSAIASVMAIGAIAACLALASGLLTAIANALSYDLHFKTLDRTATSEQRLLVARGVIVLVAIVGAYVAVHYPDQAVVLASSSLSLAASGLFPALLLGFWWKRANAEGALAGMAAGLAVCFYYLLGPQYIPVVFYETSSALSAATPEQAATYLALGKAYYLAEGAAKAQAYEDWIAQARLVANWWGVDRAFASLFAVPVGFMVMVAVSLLQDAPSTDIKNFVAELRRLPHSAR